MEEGKMRYPKSILVLLALAAFGVLLLPSAALAQGQDPAKTAFYGGGPCTFAEPVTEGTCPLGSVPAGQRLVIEFVGVWCQGAAAEEYFIYLLLYPSAGTSPSPLSAPVPVISRAAWFNGEHFVSAVLQGRLYSEGGSAVTAGVNLKARTYAPRCEAILTGYTIPVR
jgi:hypothetical protein